MGGPSAEHEISLETAKNVIEALNPKKYNIRTVLITKRGEWFTSPRYFPPSGHYLIKDIKLKKESLEKILSSKISPDTVFIAMHGTYGEDGRIQSLLDLMGIKYTGSGVLASALAMNKIKSSDLFKSHGLLVPKYFAFTKKYFKQNRHAIISKINSFGLPCIIKPVDQGSSVGVTTIKKWKDTKKSLNSAFRYSNYIMAQKYIKGIEVACGVLENPKTKKAFPLIPTEIRPKTDSFYSYQVKYTNGGADKFTPARLPKKMLLKIQQTALAAHNILGCRGMSRTDMIIKNNHIYVLEVNTIPGLTAQSLLPRGAKAMGIKFPKLLDIIIKSALH